MLVKFLNLHPYDDQEIGLFPQFTCLDCKKLKSAHKAWSFALNVGRDIMCIQTAADKFYKLYFLILFWNIWYFW